MFLGAKRGYLNFRTLYRSQLFEPTTRICRTAEAELSSARLPGLCSKTLCGKESHMYVVFGPFDIIRLEMYILFPFHYLDHRLICLKFIWKVAQLPKILPIN